MLICRVLAVERNTMKLIEDYCLHVGLLTRSVYACSTALLYLQCELTLTLMWFASVSRAY